MCVTCSPFNPPLPSVWCAWQAAERRRVFAIPLHSVFEVVSSLPRFGVGSAVKRVTWRGDDCYWAVQRVRPSLVRGAAVWLALTRSAAKAADSLHSPCHLTFHHCSTGRHPWPCVGHQGVGRRAGEAGGDQGHLEGAVAAPHAAAGRRAGAGAARQRGREGGGCGQGGAGQAERCGWAGVVTALSQVTHLKFSHSPACCSSHVFLCTSCSRSMSATAAWPHPVA